MSCAVSGCSNAKRFKPEGITFHRFPRSDDMLEKWVESLRLHHEFKWSENKFICSSHFKATDFLKAGNKIYLKSGAVPNLEVRLTYKFDVPSTNWVETDDKKNVSFTSWIPLSDDTAEYSERKPNLSELLSWQDTSASNDSSADIKRIQTEHSYRLKTYRTEPKSETENHRA